MATVLGELLDDLHKLSRPDKLRVMQFLLAELADEEKVLLQQSVDFEIWSPFDAAETADALLALLEADERSAAR